MDMKTMAVTPVVPVTPAAVHSDIPGSVQDVAPPPKTLQGPPPLPQPSVAPVTPPSAQSPPLPLPLGAAFTPSSVVTPFTPPSLNTKSVQNTPQPKALQGAEAA